MNYRSFNLIMVGFLLFPTIISAQALEFQYGHFFESDLSHIINKTENSTTISRKSWSLGIYKRRFLKQQYIGRLGFKIWNRNLKIVDSFGSENLNVKYTIGGLLLNRQNSLWQKKRAMLILELGAGIAFWDGENYNTISSGGLPSSFINTKTNTQLGFIWLIKWSEFALEAKANYNFYFPPFDTPFPLKSRFELSIGLLLEPKPRSPQTQ